MKQQNIGNRNRLQFSEAEETRRNQFDTERERKRESEMRDINLNFMFLHKHLKVHIIENQTIPKRKTEKSEREFSKRLFPFSRFLVESLKKVKHKLLNS